jgi:hypothetical protein
MELKCVPTNGLQNEHTLKRDKFLLSARNIEKKITGILREHER